MGIPITQYLTRREYVLGILSESVLNCFEDIQPSRMMQTCLLPTTPKKCIYLQICRLTSHDPDLVYLFITICSLANNYN
ncbi:hypothetical protein LOK49_LG08G02944 [Camellia lanceoleosa]|uniref:Uncharacterized protein n=1 Tax=Camellia lanceoleosa TaxID=1840588 RepID=A0ACC0GU40_9ERIC|nr:hypothetical protein LOK49_LG08G02944 [Camellia lanceoleosa]